MMGVFDKCGNKCALYKEASA